MWDELSGCKKCSDGIYYKKTPKATIIIKTKVNGFDAIFPVTFLET